MTPSRFRPASSAASKVQLKGLLQENLPPHAEERLCIDFVAHTPREHVVYFGGDLTMYSLKTIVTTMPNIQELHLTSGRVADGFLLPDPDEPVANGKLLPSLRHLRLEDLYEDDWSPLLPYLTHQTSGGQKISLTISGGSHHICKDVLREIESLVEEFVLGFVWDHNCPLDYCSISEEGED